MLGKKTIVLAEDHTILREGLRALLSLNPDYEIVGEAKDGLEAVRSVQTHTPDLLLIDISMPKISGIDAVRETRKLSPETKILVLTVHKTEEYVLEAFSAGANGYVLKDADHNELSMAISSVLRGKSYLSPDISGRVLESYLEDKKSLKPHTTWDTLTQREREILKLIAEGHKNKEIADLLCISVKTVGKHRTNLMGKLDLHSAAALTAYAADRGLIG